MSKVASKTENAARVFSIMFNFCNEGLYKVRIYARPPKQASKIMHKVFKLWTLEMILMCNKWRHDIKHKMHHKKWNWKCKLQCILMCLWDLISKFPNRGGGGGREGGRFEPHKKVVIKVDHY
jgi:hypothetical protein